VAERPGIAGGDDPSDRRRVLAAQGRIEREHLSRRGELRLRLCERDAGFKHGG
jgi:hypothetical protein